MSFSNFVSNHPLATLGFYMLACVVLGITVFTTFHALRRRIQVRKNMKARLKNDKSC